MSVTIQLDLPEALVKEAKANGLLESRRLGEMLNEAIGTGVTVDPGCGPGRRLPACVISG